MATQGLTMVIKCLTDSVSCPCIEVSKCLKVSKSATATKSDCVNTTTTPSCADATTDCCKNVTVNVVEGNTVNPTYCVSVINTEPIVRFFFGSLIIRNPNSGPVNVSEAGLVYETTSASLVYVSGKLPSTSVSGNDKIEVLMSGSFSTPAGEVITVKPYYQISGSTKTTVELPIILDAESFACSPNSWNITDCLTKTGSNSSISTIITIPGTTPDTTKVVNSFTIFDLLNAVDQTLFFTVTTTTPLSDGTYKNCFKATPVGNGNPVCSPAVTLTIGSVSPTVSFTASVTCDNIDNWCICKTDTFVPKDGNCGEDAILYNIDLTKTLHQRKCCVTLNGSIGFGTTSPSPIGASQLSFDLQVQKLKSGVWVDVGTSVTVKSPKFTLNCVGTDADPILSGDTIRLSYTYDNTIYNLATDTSTPTSPQSSTVGFTPPVSITLPATTAKSILKDLIKSECDVKLINFIEDIPSGCRDCSNPSNIYCRPIITIKSSNGDIVSYPLRNDGQDVGYGMFLANLFSPGGIDLAKEYPDAESIFITYIVTVPSCANTVTNNASIVNTSSDGIGGQGAGGMTITKRPKLTNSATKDQEYTEEPVTTLDMFDTVKSPQIMTGSMRTHSPIIVPTPVELPTVFDRVVIPVATSRPVISAPRKVVAANTSAKPGCSACAAKNKK